MSKSLLDLLIQISKVCQKSEFQIKFEKVLFLKLGPALVFGLASWALAFGQPASPSSSLGPPPSPRPSHRPPPSLRGPWPAGRPKPPPPRPGLLLTARPPGLLPLSPTSRLTEATTTGRPSAAGSPFSYPIELLPHPVTDMPPRLLSPLWLPTSLVPSRPKRPAINAATTGCHHPAHELPPPPYKSH
jgi:hypothetical protein